MIIRYGIYEPYVQYNDDRRRLNPYTNPASHLSLEIGVKDVLLHEKVSPPLTRDFKISLRVSVGLCSAYLGMFLQQDTPIPRKTTTEYSRPVSERGKRRRAELFWNPWLGMEPTSLVPNIKQLLQ